jgi:predicted nucleic acid-binding protein
MKKLKQMKAMVDDYGITVLPLSDEVERLADVYVKAGIIPEKFETDALHIATATVAGLDYIISLNFRHIVKHKTIFETEVINIREGFKRVFIHTPAEVIDHEEDD